MLAPVSCQRRGLFLLSLLLLPLAITMIAPAHASAQLADAPAFRLIGVIESRNFTGAVLDDSTGMQSFYRVREELPDGSRIVKVDNDSIRIKRADGTSYELFIIHDMKPPTPGARPPAGASVSPAAPAPAAGGAMRPERRGNPAGGDYQGRSPKAPRRSELRGSDADQQNAAAAVPRGGHTKPGDRHRDRK